MIPFVSEEEKQKLIDDLERKSLRYKNPKTPEAFFLKGFNSLQLAKLKNRHQDYEEATQAFTEAIKLRPDQKYFCFRAKAYSFAGEYQKSVHDLKYANSLPQSPDVLKNAFMKNTMNELTKMQSIRETIQKLKNNQQLPQDFLIALQELTGVSQRLVVKVGQQDQKISGITDFLTDLTSKVTSMATEFESVRKRTETLEIKNQNNEKFMVSIQKRMEYFFTTFNTVQKQCKQAENREQFLKSGAQLQKAVIKLKADLKQSFGKQLNDKIKKIEQRIDKIEVNQKILISKSKSEFEAIQKQLKNINTRIQWMEGSIKFIETKNQQNSSQLAFIDQALQQSIYPQLQFKLALEQLKANEPQIYQYANQFYWTLNNYFLAYRMVSTGIIDGKEPQPSDFQKYLPKCIKAVTSIFSIIPGVSDLMEIIEGIVDLFNFLFDEYHEKLLEIKVKKINKFLMANDLQTISTQIGKAVLSICQMKFKSVQIKTFKKINRQKENSFFDSATDWFDQKMQDFVTESECIKKIEDNPVSKLVIKDVGLFCGLIIHDDRISSLKLEKAIVEAFKGEQKSIMSEWITKMYERNKKKVEKEKSDCHIY